MAKINVLIYDGPGVANLQIPLIKAIKKCLGHCYDVIPVDHTTIYTQPWQETTRLFIVPGGRDLVFLDSIHRVEAGGDASATGLSKIRNWVKEGGSYLGICAGAYFATERIGLFQFSITKNYSNSAYYLYRIRDGSTRL